MRAVLSLLVTVGALTGPLAWSEGLFCEDDLGGRNAVSVALDNSSMKREQLRLQAEIALDALPVYVPVSTVSKMRTLIVKLVKNIDAQSSGRRNRAEYEALQGQIHELVKGVIKHPRNSSIYIDKRVRRDRIYSDYLSYLYSGRGLDLALRLKLLVNETASEQFLIADESPEDREAERAFKKYREADSNHRAIESQAKSDLKSLTVKEVEDRLSAVEKEIAAIDYRLMNAPLPSELDVFLKDLVNAKTDDETLATLRARAADLQHSLNLNLPDYGWQWHLVNLVYAVESILTSEHVAEEKLKLITNYLKSTHRSVIMSREDFKGRIRLESAKRILDLILSRT